MIAVTLAFAICWLPIHILELMQCANSPLLRTLIESYPKALYSFRAFTHALAYFNSCLNPYLYALLNRNFCIDLVDIVPLWSLCCQRTRTLEHEDTYLHTNLPARTALPNSNLFAEKDLDDDDDDDDNYKNSIDNDHFQVELVGVQRKDLSSSSTSFYHLSS